MNELHLLVPDLLLPRDVLHSTCSGLQLPFLSKILARSQMSTHNPCMAEDVLCQNFGVQAIAPLRAKADGLAVSDEFWLCADPVHFELQQSEVILRPDVQCGTDESTILCAELNRYFAQDGLTFFAPHPQRWYIRSTLGSRVEMTPLRVAAWRDVKAYQPQGDDAMPWRKLSNEMQMLLHGHAVNQARQARGERAINSVWLWGGGCANAPGPQVDVIGSDEMLLPLLARANAIPHAASMEAMLKQQGARGLWMTSCLSAAWHRGDLYAWRDTLQRFEHELAQPLWHAIRRGELQTLILDAISESDTRRFTLNRAASWKVWRGSAPISDYVV